MRRPLMPPCAPPPQPRSALFRDARLTCLLFADAVFVFDIISRFYFFFAVHFLRARCCAMSAFGEVMFMWRL